MHEVLRLVIPAVLAASGVLSATAPERDAISNWTAPPYWTRPAQSSEEPASRDALASGRKALFPAPQALPFFALTPCRVVDTRAGSGFADPYGPPSMPEGVARSFPIAGQCGVPSGAVAVSFNFTVTNTLGPGFLTAYPEGGAFPGSSTLNYLANQTIANAAVVQLSNGGGLSAVAGVSGFDLIIDVNGYYAPSAVVTSLNTLTGDVTLTAGANTQITPGGNSLTISSTGTLTGVTAGTGLTGGGTSGTPTLGIAAGGITADRIASGQVVTSLNGATDAVTLTAGAGINVAGLTVSSKSSGTFYKTIAAISCVAQGTAISGDAGSCGGGGTLRTDGSINFPCVVRARSTLDSYVCDLGLPAGAVLHEVLISGYDLSSTGYFEGAVWATSWDLFVANYLSGTFQGAWQNSGLAADPGVVSFPLFLTSDAPVTIDGNNRYVVGFATKDPAASVEVWGIRIQYSIP